MGILNFHKSIKEHHPGSFAPEFLPTYDHVYIDINFALHYCAYNVNTKIGILNKLTKFIENVVQETCPRKSVVFAADGAAPLAKLLLQRKRRSAVDASSISKANEQTDQEFSTLMFTAGTIFMKNINIELDQFFKYLKSTYLVDVIFLDPKANEAELKLKHQIDLNMKNNENDTHVVVTNDSDVIVMLATTKYFYNTYVYIKSFSSEFVSIGKLIDLHTDKFGMSENCGLDFAAVNIFLGNDYLPKLKFVSFTKIWTCYKNIVAYHPQGLVVNNLINVTFLKKMLFVFLGFVKPSFINKITAKNTFGDIYANYLDGYNWCMNMYNSGVCTRFNYMYSYKEGPHPLALMLNLSAKQELLNMNTVISNPLPQELYAILLLPTSAIGLIEQKYHKFLKKSKTLDILHGGEFCKQCDAYKIKLKKMGSVKKSNKKKSDEKSDKQKSDEKSDKKISETTKEFRLHKSMHDNITIADVEDISNEFCKMFKST